MHSYDTKCTGFSVLRTEPPENYFHLPFLFCTLSVPVSLCHSADVGHHEAAQLCAHPSDLVRSLSSTDR